MADAVVITASFGGYDTVWPAVDQDVATDWLCVTDDPTLEAPRPWRVRVVRATHVHPRSAAKRPKLEPWRYVEQRHVVWIDASMQVTSRAFVAGALAARHDGLAAWRHPERSCIYDEAEASVALVPAKYGHVPVREQVASYRDAGYPAGAGLYACGTLAWDLDSPRAHLVGEAWLAECERWTYQDQLSLPVVARRLGVRPGRFPHRLGDRRRRAEQGAWIANPWLRIHPHRFRT